MSTTSCQISYYVTSSLVDVFDKGKVSYFLSYLALTLTVSSVREWYATTCHIAYYVYNTRLLLVICIYNTQLLLVISRTNDKFHKGTVCYYLSCLYHVIVFLIDGFDWKKGCYCFSYMWVSAVHQQENEILVFLHASIIAVRVAKVSLDFICWCLCFAALECFFIFVFIFVFTFNFIFVFFFFFIFCFENGHVVFLMLVPKGLENTFLIG